MLSNSYEDLAYLTTSNTISYKSKNTDLTQAVKDRIKFFATISKVNFKKIEENIEDDIFIDINEIELERIIDNNLSNAIKYGFKDEIITVTLKQDKNKVILEFKSFGNEIKNKVKIRLYRQKYRLQRKLPETLKFLQTQATQLVLILLYEQDIWYSLSSRLNESPIQKLVQ